MRFFQLNQKQHQKRNDDDTDDPRPCKCVVAGIQSDINGCRQRLGNTRDIPGKHQGGAEFTERPRQTENASGQQRWIRQRNGDMDKHPPSACSVYHCRSLYIGVNIGKSGFGRLIHKRKSHDSRSNHSSPPGEDHGLMKDPFDRLSDEAVLSKHDDQNKTDNGGRKNERKHKNRFEYGFSEK